MQGRVRMARRIIFGKVGKAADVVTGERIVGRGLDFSA
jgi:hypothetical protein